MYVGYARGWPPAHFVSGTFHINVFWTRGEGAEGGGGGERVLPFSHLRDGGANASILRGYRDETRVYYVREHVCCPLMTIDYPRIPAAPSSRCYTYLPTTSSFSPFVHRNIAPTPICPGHLLGLPTKGSHISTDTVRKRPVRRVPCDDSVPLRIEKQTNS